MWVKPACRKLRAAASSVLLKAESGIEMVPGKRMCSLGGEMLPSGT